MNAKRVFVAVGAILAFWVAVTLYRRRDIPRIRDESVPNRARLDDGREVGIVKF